LRRSVIHFPRSAAPDRITTYVTVEVFSLFTMLPAGAVESQMYPMICDRTESGSAAQTI